MTYSLTDQELTEIEQRYQAADEGFPHDKLTFYRHADTDVPRLIASLRQARDDITRLKTMTGQCNGN